MYIGFYIKFLYYSNKFVNIVNLNIHILITYNHVKTQVCCVWRFFQNKDYYYYYLYVQRICFDNVLWENVMVPELTTFYFQDVLPDLKKLV